jgi:hypothetical protein
MLRVARADAPYWEHRLARYGLSWSQLRNQDVQHLAGRDRLAVQSYQFDSELGRHWKTQAQAHTPLSASELSSMSRISARAYGRDVPRWAHCDTCCRRLLVHLYPALVFDPNDRVLIKRYGRPYLRQCMAGVRQRAARCWLMLYFSFRLGMTTDEIAEELGVTNSAVENKLYSVRNAANKLFGA